MKDKANSLLEEDTEEMKKRRGMSQDEMDQCWRSLAERMEGEVLDKYKIEISKREAFKGRRAQLEWRRVRRSKKNKIRKWRDDCWARIFALFREYNLQRQQSKQEESTEEEEMKQQQRMEIVKDLSNKIRSKGRTDAEIRWWVSELLAADCENAWIHPEWEDTMQKFYNLLEDMKKKDEKEKREDIISTRWRKESRVRKAVLGFCTKSRSQHHEGAEHRSWRKNKRMRGCWTVVEQRAKHGQNTGKCRMWMKSLGTTRS